MTYLPPANGGRINANITGNTANAGTVISNGTMVLAGGNNITLSQAGSTITISGGAGGGGAGSNTLGMSNLGNTSGTTGVISGSNLQFAFAGGNNVTLSQSLNASSGTITISAASQSIQTQGLQTAVINGNTAGATASISSGAMTLAGGNNITLSQAGNAITISGGAGGGGGGGIAAVPDSIASTFNTGTVNFSDAGGALTISASTAGGGGQTINFSVPATSSLSATGLLSISSNVSTISIGVPDRTVSSYVNMLPASTGSQTLGALGATTGSAQFYPVSIDTPVQFNALRVAMNFSFATSTVSGQQTVSHTFGIYSRNAGSLSLISSNSLTYNATNSSVSATISAATSTGTGGYGYGSITASTTAQIHSNFGTVGLRQIDLQFGDTMSLDRGIYWLGMLRRESSSGANVGLSIGLAGNIVGPVNAMGIIGTHSGALTTNSALKAPYLGFGPYTSTGSAGYGGTALPSAAIVSGIAHTGSILPFMTFISS